MRRGASSPELVLAPLQAVPHDIASSSRDARGQQSAAEWPCEAEGEEDEEQVDWDVPIMLDDVRDRESVGAESVGSQQDNTGVRVRRRQQRAEPGKKKRAAKTTGAARPTTSAIRKAAALAARRLETLRRNGAIVIDDSPPIFTTKTPTRRSIASNIPVFSTVKRNVDKTQTKRLKHIIQLRKELSGHENTPPCHLQIGQASSSNKDCRTRLSAELRGALLGNAVANSEPDRDRTAGGSLQVNRRVPTILYENAEDAQKWQLEAAQAAARSHIRKQFLGGDVMMARTEYSYAFPSAACLLEDCTDAKRLVLVASEGAFCSAMPSRRTLGGILAEARRIATNELKGGEDSISNILIMPKWLRSIVHQFCLSILQMEGACFDAQWSAIVLLSHVTANYRLNHTIDKRSFTEMDNSSLYLFIRYAKTEIVKRIGLEPKRKRILERDYSYKETGSSWNDRDAKFLKGSTREMEIAHELANRKFGSVSLSEFEISLTWWYHVFLSERYTCVLRTLVCQDEFDNQSAVIETVMHQAPLHPLALDESVQMNCQAHASAIRKSTQRVLQTECRLLPSSVAWQVVEPDAFVSSSDVGPQAWRTCVGIGSHHNELHQWSAYAVHLPSLGSFGTASKKVGIRIMYSVSRLALNDFHVADKTSNKCVCTLLERMALLSETKEARCEGSKTARDYAAAKRGVRDRDRPMPPQVVSPRSFIVAKANVFIGEVDEAVSEEISGELSEAVKRMLANKRQGAGSNKKAPPIRYETVVDAETTSNVRTETLVTPVDPVALGVMFSRILSNGSLTRSTRFINSGRIISLAGADKNTYLAEDESLSDKLHLPVLSIVDFTMDHISPPRRCKWDRADKLGPTKEVSVGVTYTVAGSRAVRVVDAARDLIRIGASKNVFASSLRNVISLYLIGASQSLLVDEILEQSFCNATTDINGCRRVSCANLAVPSLDLNAAYVAGRNNSKINCVDTPWESVSTCPVDFGFVPAGRDCNHLFSDNRNPAKCPVSSKTIGKMTVEMCRHFYEKCDANDNVYSARPLIARGVPQLGLRRGVHCALNSFDRAVITVSRKHRSSLLHDSKASNLPSPFVSGAVFEDDESTKREYHMSGSSHLECDDTECPMCAPHDDFQADLLIFPVSAVSQNRRPVRRDVTPEYQGRPSYRWDVLDPHACGNRAFFPNATDDQTSIFDERHLKTSSFATQYDDIVVQATAYDQADTFRALCVLLARLVEAFMVATGGDGSFDDEHAVDRVLQAVATCVGEFCTAPRTDGGTVQNSNALGAIMSLVLNGMFPCTWHCAEPMLLPENAKAASGCIAAYQKKMLVASQPACAYLSLDEWSRLRIWWGRMQRGLPTIAKYLTFLLSEDGSLHADSRKLQQHTRLLDAAMCCAWTVHSLDGKSPPPWPCPCYDVSSPQEIRYDHFLPVNFDDESSQDMGPRGGLVAMSACDARMLLVCIESAHLLRSSDQGGIQVHRNVGPMCYRVSADASKTDCDGSLRSSKATDPLSMNGRQMAYGDPKDRVLSSKKQLLAWERNYEISMPLYTKLTPPTKSRRERMRGLYGRAQALKQELDNTLHATGIPCGIEYSATRLFMDALKKSYRDGEHSRAESILSSSVSDEHN